MDMLITLLKVIKNNSVKKKRYTQNVYPYYQLIILYTHFYDYFKYLLNGNISSLSY